MRDKLVMEPVSWSKPTWIWVQVSAGYGSLSLPPSSVPELMAPNVRYRYTARTRAPYIVHISTNNNSNTWPNWYAAHYINLATHFRSLSLSLQSHFFFTSSTKKSSSRFSLSGCLSISCLPFLPVFHVFIRNALYVKESFTFKLLCEWQ